MAASPRRSIFRDFSVSFLGRDLSCKSLKLIEKTSVSKKTTYMLCTVLLNEKSPSLASPLSRDNISLWGSAQCSDSNFNSVERLLL